jgi:hypothetical protein
MKRQEEEDEELTPSQPVLQAHPLSGVSSLHHIRRHQEAGLIANKRKRRRRVVVKVGGGVWSGGERWFVGWWCSDSG